MQIIKDIKELRSLRASLRSEGIRLGLVPTMGYLHEGHLSLVEGVKKGCDKTIVSIFVNPLQFNNKDDLLKYPIDIESDCALLEGAGADYVFLPTAETIYPRDNQSRVNVLKLSSPLEGVFRPGHFEGVATVVSILFNLVEPDCAIFGEKDFQQLRIIEQMVSDLHFPIEILRGKIVREADGLAMSSRNVRLSSEGRTRALFLSRALFAVKEAVKNGERKVHKLRDLVDAEARNNPSVKIEYFEVVSEGALMPVVDLDLAQQYRALIAAEVEGVRLIDNEKVGC